MYFPKHRAPVPAAWPWRDLESLAVDPPPVHPSGLVAGKRRAIIATDSSRNPSDLRALTAMVMSRGWMGIAWSERGSSSLAPLIIAAWMGTFVLVGIGAFLRMIAGTP